MKLLSLNVYRFPLGDCTNGGISGDVTTIYMVHDEGPFDANEIDDRLIFREEKRGENYYALVPIIQPKGKLGPMAGGNIAYSSDSRCKHAYHIHDRFETQELYNALSV